MYKLVLITGVALIATPAFATNLVINGSFEQLSVAAADYSATGSGEALEGFVSDYFIDSRNGAGASGAHFAQGSGFGYAGIVTSSNAWHPSFASFGAQDGDNFLIVNGAGSAFTVWQQDVSGAQGGQTYEFSFYARNAFSASPANIDITAYMGNTVLANFTADLSQGNPNPNSQWVRFSALWTGLADPTQIRLVDTNSAFSGNDFAIDNIQLVAVVPLPAHLALAGVGLVGLRRRRRSTI